VDLLGHDRICVDGRRSDLVHEWRDQGRAAQRAACARCRRADGRGDLSSQYRRKR
jgi:hypothetical protein